MTVNIKIANVDVIPIPYIGKCGDNVIAYSLNKDEPILMDALWISSTTTKQLLVHGTKNDVILPLSTSLEITFI